MVSGGQVINLLVKDPRCQQIVQVVVLTGWQTIPTSDDKLGKVSQSDKHVG